MLINRRIGEIRQDTGCHRPGAGRLTATAASVQMIARRANSSSIRNRRQPVAYPSSCRGRRLPRLAIRDQALAQSSSGARALSRLRPWSVSRYPPPGLVGSSPALRSSESRALSTLGDMESQRLRSSRKLSVSCLSSQSTRRVQRRPRRSRAAMIGRPVLDPRTLCPGSGVRDLRLARASDSVTAMVHLLRN